MAFASFETEDSGDLAEINMIPLIDVMLVLLVIFMVTAPLLTHAVKVDLPKAASDVNFTPPAHVQIGIDAQARLFWAGEAVSTETLQQKLRDQAAADPHTELQLRADQVVPYGIVAKVMSQAATAGLTRIGFVTDPSRND